MQADENINEIKQNKFIIMIKNVSGSINKKVNEISYFQRKYSFQYIDRSIINIICNYHSITIIIIINYYN